jgi:hypothetical protein
MVGRVRDATASNEYIQRNIEDMFCDVLEVRLDLGVG